MADRRALIEGLKPAHPPVDPIREKQFVFGEAEKKEPLATITSMERARLTTRIRADMTTALKRASLERQLSGTFPNTLQDILEEAIEPWLKTNGYL